ncbi:MAG TPA: condensation domain-containing protein, partial [Streptosporangiaceae bacterium]|nr:condensation domain-containing protein [Streptosporangiaceae bacterium]
MVIRDGTHESDGKGASARSRAPSIDEQTWNEHLRYWRKQLADVTVVRLPGDDFGSRDGLPLQTCESELPADLINWPSQPAAEYVGSPLNLVIVAVQILLARYTGSDDICVATMTSPADRGGMPSCGDGPVDVLMLRSRMTGSATLRDYLRQVASTMAEARAHSAIPFDALVHELRLRPELARAVVVEGLMPVPSGTDLTVRLCSGKNGARSAVVEYRPDRSGTPTARQMAAHLVDVLHAILADPDASLGQIENSLLSGVESVGAASVGVGGSLGEVFGGCVAGGFGVGAVVFDGGVLSYGE